MIVQGHWRGTGFTDGRRRLSRNWLTLVRALVRYGWFDLAAKTVDALRAGGPALLLRKFRQQRAFVDFNSGPEIGATSPLSANDSHSAAAGAAFTVRADFSLPFVEFARFLNLWHQHPAITGLAGRRAERVL